MKAHGIYQGAQPIRETTIASRPFKRAADSGSESKSVTGSGKKSKKRKQDQFNDANNTDIGDDDEGLQKVKPEPIKSDPEAVVKEEPAAADEHSQTFPESPAEGGYKATEEHSSASEHHVENVYQPVETSFFNDFLHPGAFDHPVLPGPGAFGQPPMPTFTEYTGAFPSNGYQGLGGGQVDGSGGEAVHDSIVIGD